MKFIIFLLLISQAVVLSQNKDTLRVIKLQVDTTTIFGIMKKISNDPIKVAEPTDVPIKDSDLFLIRKDGFYGFIDREGNIRIKPQFYLANDFSEGLAYADLGYTRGFIDKTGKLIIDLKGYASDYFSEGIALISYSWMGTEGFGGSSFKYIDKDANLLFKQSFAYATPFKDNYAFVKTSESTKLISKDSVITELPLEITPYAFSEGIARFYKQIDKNIKWGFIDTIGKILIKPAFDNAQDFSEGIAMVSRKDTTEDRTLIYHACGYINKKGEIVIDLKYDDATDFSGGVALVRIDKTCLGIDKKGNEIFSVDNFYPGDSYAPHSKFSDGLARGTFLGKGKGFINTAGNIVIKTQYRNAFNFRNGLARIYPQSTDFGNINYGEWLYIDKTGKITFNPESLPSSIVPDSLKTKPRRTGIQ